MLAGHVGRAIGAACVMAATACSGPAERPAVSPGTALTVIHEVGTLDGPLAFGRIGFVGANSSGTIAAYDLGSCQVTVLDTSGTLIGKFGRCGMGPTDLGSVDAVAVTSTGVWVHDGHQMGTLRQFSFDGALITSSKISVVEGWSGFASLSVLGDSIAVVSPIVPPGELLRAGVNRVVAFRLSTGESFKQLAPLPDSVVSLRWTNGVEWIPSCAGETPQGSYLAYLDQWSFSGAIGPVFGAGEEHRFAEVIEWARPATVFNLPPGRFRPGFSALGVVCTARWSVRMEERIRGPHLFSEFWA